MSVDTQSVVEAAIDTYLAPLIASDEGTIRLVGCTEDTITVELGGACDGCPARTITRDTVIAPLLRRVLGRDVTIELS